MSRIIIEQTLLAQQKLVKSTNKKHKADGASSILKPVLTKNKIDLDKDEADMAAAVVLNDSMETQEALSENARAARDDNFKPALAFMRLAAKNIKQSDGGGVTNLKLWGIPVNGTRIALPYNFVDCQKVWVKFFAYHTSLGAGSPMTGFATDNGYDIGVLNTNAVASVTNNDDMMDHAKQAEKLKGDRDKLWNPVKKHLPLVGNFLKSYFPSNPKKAGDWGYQVDDSVQAPKERKMTVAFAAKKTTKKAKIGGYFTNVGKVDVKIYKGAKAEGTPIVLVPGEKKGILEGYSTVTIVNESDMEKVVLMVTTT
jgi:hypothetical protein